MSRTNNYICDDFKQLGSPLHGLKTALGNLDLEKVYYVFKNRTRVMN